MNYEVVSTMNARGPDGNQFCICQYCRKKYPFLKEKIEEYEKRLHSYPAEESTNPRPTNKRPEKAQ